MQNTPDSDSRSPPQFGGVVTRAQTGPRDTAQPLTSGLQVIEKEHDSRQPPKAHSATSADTTPLTSIPLRRQHSRLGANIALSNNGMKRCQILNDS